jgi:cellulose synthase operon protein C
MMSICEKLQVFADGELPAGEVPEFERHFADCAGCQAELEEVMVLEGLAQSLRRPVELPALERVPPLSAPPRRSRRSTLVLAALAGVSAVAAGALAARLVRDARRDEPPLSHR